MTAVRDIIKATVALLSAVEQSPHRAEFEAQVTLLRNAVNRHNQTRTESQ